MTSAWDVIVVGGGPAGMMAAGRAASLGARVLLVEKNDAPGKKLLITGGGRCNLTNAELDTRKFLSKFKGSDQFLFSAFAQFGVKETLDFFHARGVPTKVEAALRVFPASDRAASVRQALMDYMKEGRVTLLCGASVTGLVADGGRIEAVRIKQRSTIKEMRASAFILTTGGTSRPDTGSTGDGFVWLKRLGHTVKEQGAMLVPVAVKDAWVKRLQGVSIPDVGLTIMQNGAKHGATKGKILFTHFGISGPMVLNASRDIGELLKYGEVSLLLDLFPKLDPGALDRRVRELFEKGSNKQFKNILHELVPAALAPVLVALSAMRGDMPANSVTREERRRFVVLLKNIPLRVAGMLGANKAIVTSGGVALTEVDFKTMRSRKFSNLYLAGDILDVDRPSGGYSLQLCWTTGYVAGTQCAVRQQA